MKYRSSSSDLGLWVVRKLWQVPSQRGNTSGEGECSPSLGPDRSVALPGKTRGLGASLVALISDPKIELVDSPLALEVRSLLSLAVMDETALRGIDHPVALVARGAYRREWSANFRDLIEYRHVISFIGLHVQTLLAHVGHPSGSRRHIALTAFGSYGFRDLNLGG